MPNPLNM